VEALGYEHTGWLVGAGVALGLWLSYVVTTHGIHLLSRFNSILTPALVIIVVYMFYMLISTHGWGAILAAPPLDPTPSPALNYAIVVELGIASGMSWWGGIGFLARNTKTRRNAIYPQVLQLGLMSGAVCSIALFSGLVVGSDDPTRWMIPLGGIFMGVLALVFVAMANITSTSVSIYASGLALRHIPGMHKRAWRQIVAITSTPLACFVIWPSELYDLGDAFLAYNGTMHAPVGGILLVDYFFLRKQRLDLAAIYEAAPSGAYYYWRGFNILALGSVVLGQLSYFLIYNPFTVEAHWLFNFLPASIAAFVLPALLYWLGMRFWLPGYLPASRDTMGATPVTLLQPNI
jgi:NCS1 family nucleobase:cation symporter-1